MNLPSQLSVIVTLIAAGWVVLMACEPDVMVPARVRQRFSKRRGSRK
jgi:hypothetical protein